MSKDAFIIARVDIDLKKKIEEKARKEGVSVSELLRQILENV